MARPEARGTSDGVWREGKRDTPRLFRGRLKREEGRRKSQWLPGAPPASSMEACPVVTVPLGIHRSHAPCPRISPWAQFPFTFHFSACISIPGSGRSPGGGKGNPLWYSCLGNPKDRGNPWQATVHGVTKSQIRPSSRACIQTPLYCHSPCSSQGELLNL